MPNVLAGKDTTRLCTYYPYCYEILNPHSELAGNEPEKGAKSLCKAKKGRQRVRQSLSEYVDCIADTFHMR